MHIKRVILLSGLFCVSFVEAAANHPKLPATVPTIQQWEVIDLSFKIETTAEAPFEVEFGAVFTGPDQAELNVPGFYNGDNQYILRFSATTEGAWSFKTFSSAASLANRSGRINVAPNTDPEQHGGLVTDRNKPRHFFYEDGSPCMVLAFECDWLFALDYDNPTAAPKTEQLLQQLATNGINQIVTTVYSYDVKWDKDPLLAEHPEHEYGGLDPIYPFLGSNKKPDFSSLNIDFFKRFDRIVDLMNKYGITAHLMIYVWNKEVQWPAPESTADNRYFDYIIKRYQAYPNVLWDISKEALNNKRCTEAYGIERIQRIRRLDAFKRLITVHDGGFCQRNTDKVDFISWQIWSATIYNNMLDAQQNYSTLPIFNIEHGGYEKAPYTVFPGDYDNPEVCLRRNWLIHFAGVYSTYYWQGAAWNVIIHNPYELPDRFIKPRFEYYRHLQSFFKKYPFCEFSPSPKDNQSAYCMTDKKGTYLFYIPKEHYQLSKYGWKSKGTIQWYNTLTGEYTAPEPDPGTFCVSPWRGVADAVLIRKTK